MHANSRQEIDTVYSGDIAAAVGLKDTGTGENTLCGEKNDIILESMDSQSQLFTYQYIAENLKLTKDDSKL